MRRELKLARLHLMSSVLEKRTVGIPHEQKPCSCGSISRDFPKSSGRDVADSNNIGMLFYGAPASYFFNTDLKVVESALSSQVIYTVRKDSQN